MQGKKQDKKKQSVVPVLKHLHRDIGHLKASAVTVMEIIHKATNSKRKWPRPAIHTIQLATVW